MDVNRLKGSVLDHEVLEGLKLGHGADDGTELKKDVDAGKIWGRGYEDLAAVSCAD